MNINLYKEYHFSHNILTATNAQKEYSFSIIKNDQFYHYKKRIIKK